MASPEDIVVGRGTEWTFFGAGRGRAEQLRISVKWNTHSGMWNTNSGEVERSSERSDVERSVPPSRFATGT